MKSKNKHSHVIIIGGTAAGPKTAAAIARRKKDVTVTLFEKSKHISYATCGLPYFASGDINSFSELTTTPYGIARDEDFFKHTKGIEVITNAEVIDIDRDNKRVTVKNIDNQETYNHSYDKLVLATGSAVNQPPFPVPESPKVRHFTTPEDAIEFRQAAEKGEVETAAIIGGGFIGCELAESMGGLWGIETTLIEMEDQLLPSLLDKEMSDIAIRDMGKEDINVMTGSKVSSIELDDNGDPQIKLSNGETINTNYVLLCLGVHPNIELAEKCGLSIGKTGGIEVDSTMKTSDEKIYAGGDCVESLDRITGSKVFIPMGSLANRQGRVIAENITGYDSKFNGVTRTFILKVFENNIGATGISESQAEKAGIKVNSVWASFIDKPDYYPESKSFTLKMIYSESDNKLIGLQAVGKGDISRRIDVFSSLIQNGSKIDDLLDFEQSYAPPFSEAIDPLFHMGALVKARQRGISIVNPGTILDTKDTLWLDVREAEEAEAEPWPDMDKIQYTNIPLNDLRRNVEKIDKGKKIMIICKRGPRSYQASAILKNSGYEDVHIIGGGTLAIL